MACDTCEGSGWCWWDTARVWVACATGHDDGAKPKPRVVEGTQEQRN